MTPSLHIDFGEHRDEYITISTQEGEAIGQLLSGYIDIMINRRKKDMPLEEEINIGIHSLRQRG